MKILRIPLLALLMFLFFSFVHDYYVSLTQIEYVEDKQSLQIITRVDFEDLEYTLQERYDTSIDLTTLDEKASVAQYIERYINDKLMIRLNGKIIRFNFIGKKYDNDQVVCYLEAENIENINSLTVENTVLFGNFPKQRNVIRLNIYSEKYNLLCTKGDDTKKLKFNTVTTANN